MCVFLVIVSGTSEAKVYVYEVVTAETTFHTASKLMPKDFLMYNGGRDIILRLKLLRTYNDKDFEQAVRDFGLEDKNVRFLPHQRINNSAPDKRRSYNWWR